MKKTKKTIHARILSLILTMAMALAVLPSAASATSTSTLDQLRETHPAGSYFRTYYQNGQEMAWECMGYAYQLMYEAYGTYMYSGYDNYDVNYCLDNLKAGDVIRYAPNGIRHSIFITAVDGENVCFTDSNGGAGYCIVRWDNWTTKSKIRASFKYATPGLWDLAPASSAPAAPAVATNSVTDLYSQYLPMKAMLLTTDRQDCYDSYGGAKVGRIYENDQVTIQEIVQYNGELWCKLVCPWTENGRSFNKTVYAPLRYFVYDTSYSPWSGKTASQITSYWRSDYSLRAGYTGKGDICLVVGEYNSRYQLIYPLSSGGFKLAFI